MWSYAKMIGELEQIDPETQYILEVAAITHDIACRYAGKSMAIPMASIRKKKESH